MSTSATNTHRVKRKPPPSLEQYPEDVKRADSTSAIAFELFPDLLSLHDSPTDLTRKGKQYGQGQGHYTVRRRTLSTLSTPSLIRDLSDSSSSTSVTRSSGSSSIASLGSIGVLVPTPSPRRMSMQPPPPPEDHTSASSKQRNRFLGIAIGARKNSIDTENPKKERRVSVPISSISSPSFNPDTKPNIFPRQTHIPSGYTSEPEHESDFHPIPKPWVSSIPRKRSSLNLVTNGTLDSSNTAGATVTTGHPVTTTATTRTNTKSKAKTISGSHPAPITSVLPTSSLADQTKTVPPPRATNAKTNDDIEGGLYVSPRPAPVPSSINSATSTIPFSTSPPISTSHSTSSISHHFFTHKLPKPTFIPAHDSSLIALVRSGNVSSGSEKTSSTHTSAASASVSVSTNTNTNTNTATPARRRFFAPIFRRRRRNTEVDGEKVIPKAEPKPNAGIDKEDSTEGGHRVDYESVSKPRMPHSILPVQTQTDMRWEDDAKPEPKPTNSSVLTCLSNVSSTSDCKSYLDLSVEIEAEIEWGPLCDGELGRSTVSVESQDRDSHAGRQEYGSGQEKKEHGSGYGYGCGYASGPGYGYGYGYDQGHGYGYGYGYEAFRRGGKLDLGLGLEAVDEVESRGTSWCGDKEAKGEEYEHTSEREQPLGLGSRSCCDVMRGDEDDTWIHGLKSKAQGEGKSEEVKRRQVEDSDEDLLREEELMRELMNLRKRRKGRREREQAEVEIKA